MPNRNTAVTAVDRRQHGESCRPSPREKVVREKVVRESADAAILAAFFLGMQSA